MRSYSGKTVEEAVNNAINDMGVAKEEIKYYVTEEKTGGLFGLGNKATIEAYSYRDIEEFLEDYLDKYFKGINLPVEIVVKRGEDGTYLINLNAENNAILIGKNGQTLEAIKTVLNAAANAEFKTHVYMMVDINGYKEERYEKLKNTVERIAKTVAKTHVPARLGDLTSDERKVVHQHLSTMPHIRTESEGSGNDRRLKIMYDKNKE